MVIKRYNDVGDNLKHNLETYSIKQRNIRCADYFTKYSSSAELHNFNRLLLPVKSIEKELPKLHFVLSFLNAKYEKPNILMGKKHELIIYFRIFRLMDTSLYRNQLDILVDILKNTNIGIFKALFLTEFLRFNTARSLNYGIIRTIPNLTLPYYERYGESKLKAFSNLNPNNTYTFSIKKIHLNERISKNIYTNNKYQYISVIHQESIYKFKMEVLILSFNNYKFGIEKVNEYVKIFYTFLDNNPKDYVGILKQYDIFNIKLTKLINKLKINAKNK